MEGRIVHKKVTRLYLLRSTARRCQAQGRWSAQRPNTRRIPRRAGDRLVQSLDDARRRPPGPDGRGIGARATRGDGGAGRIPPHNLEAEESLLGAMMLSREAITAAVEVRLEGGDFYKPAHGVVFDAALALHARGEPIDPVSMAEELRRSGQLEGLGGSH